MQAGNYSWSGAIFPGPKGSGSRKTTGGLFPIDGGNKTAAKAVFLFARN
jgi:hypothetical protein